MPLLLPPIGFMDVSMLLAISAVVLLVTAELASPRLGLTNLNVDRKKLRNVILVVSILFFVMVSLRAIGFILS